MAGQGSARVSLREIDLSAPTPVNRVLTGTPAGVVGRAKRGPAFIPTIFSNIQEFQDIFGSFSDKGLDSNSNLFGPLAVNEWMSGNPGQGAFVRLLGAGNTPGFTVGTKQLGTNGNEISNSFANNTNNVNIAGKTFMLGHFAKSVTNSKYLSESGIKKIPLREVSKIVVTNTSDGINTGDTLTIKAYGDPQSEEKTFTFDGNGPASATVIQHNGTDAIATATAIKNAINSAFNTTKKVIATSSTNTVTLTQFVDDISGNINISVTKTGAAGLTITMNDLSSSDTQLFTLLRGVLMTPHNVKATVESNIAGKEEAPQNNQADSDVGYSIGNIDTTTLGFTLYLVGHLDTNINKIECSFDPSQSNYFAKVLNKDPHKIEEYGHYLYSHYDIDKNIISLPSDGDLKKEDNTNASITACGTFCVSSGEVVFENFQKRFQTAVSPWVVSQDFGIEPDGSNNSGIGDSVIKLFRFHALDDGEIGNNQIKVTVSNLVKGEFGGFGTFDVAIEKLDTNPLKNSVLVGWKRLSLDPNSLNYIARIIGDKRVYWDFDASKPGLQEEGSYSVTNKYVRVEVSDEVKNLDLPAETLPCGFAGIKQLHFTKENGDAYFVENTKLLTNYLKYMTEPPIPMIRSIGKIVQSATESKEPKVMPWGIKFAEKLNLDVGDNGFKEYIEQRFNNSIKNYSKLFNENIWNIKYIEGDSTKSQIDYANDHNFFHLEKIRITKKVDNSIDNTKWGDAIFVRNSDVSSDTAPTDASASRRFFRMKNDLSLSNSKYLSFSFFMQGGFDGLNIFDIDQHHLSDAACVKEAKTQNKTGSSIETYQKAIDVYSDKAAAEIQLLVVPGIREPSITNYGVLASESRFDTLYLMDPEQVDATGTVIVDSETIPSVNKTIQTFASRSLDTSFAASFFPDVVLNKPNGGSIKVPPTIAALGVMSRADNGGNAPWYAPAGINRGLVNASATEFSISREQLDELYDNDINPIYIPAGRDQVYVFGQKTLLKNPSALDRINVRRLLIYVRRKVKQIANSFLFSPNREDTLKAFSNAVEPIMANIKAQQGVERYKVQIDTSTTTQSDVENNTIRGKIYLQPTKSTEFISLDFEVRNSID